MAVLRYIAVNLSGNIWTLITQGVALDGFRSVFEVNPSREPPLPSTGRDAPRDPRSNRAGNP
jgi:hypothetical protein